MKRITLTTYLLVIFILANAQTLPSKANILSRMKLANDYWISANSSPGNNQWARAVYFAGNLEFYKIYPKTSYLDYALNWANLYSWGLNGGTTTRNADNQTCGQAYIDMYNLDAAKQSSKISAIKTSIDRMVSGKSSADWTWIDAIFMSMPVFAKLGTLTGDTTYFNRMYDFYAYNKYTLGLYNSTEGLWYRDVNYKPPYSTQNGQDCYWARGNGWVIGAHVRILQLLPLTDKHRDEYVETFRAMAAALKDRQRTDGFWNPSLDDPNEYAGPETSGTAFFTYGIAWGINNHLLDSVTYYPVVVKAWNALANTSLQSNGFLGYVQGVGAAPAQAFAGTTQDFGVGGFLMAGTEVQKLAAGTLPLPVNFNLKSVKATAKNKITATFNNKLNYSTALNTQNYSIANVTINSVTQGTSDSSVVLTVSDLPFGAYVLATANIQSTKGETVESGESMSFVWSGIVAVTASGYETGTSNTADKTLDYDLSTRWSCDGKGQWILYDLGETKMVSSVDLAFYNGNTRKAMFAIYLSTNITDSAMVFNGSSSGTTTATENYDFTDRPARYIRIIGQGNTVSTWNSITETRINWTDLVADIHQPNSNGIKIYPVPAKGDMLYISSEKAYNRIEIVDMQGKRIVKAGQKNSINIAAIPTGNYVLTLFNYDGSTSKTPFIKQ